MRVEGDLRNEKITYKVREHSMAKIPVLIVVGKKEGAERTVSIRRLGSPDQTSMSLDEAIARRLPAGTPVLRVWNKIDLVSLAAHTDEQAVWLSARTGEGIDLLRAALLRLAGWQGAGEGLFMARERHLQALREAREHLTVAHAHAQRRDAVLDLFAEELRLAQEALNRITGEFGADDLLGVIFSRFCIGK
jgi:tRNA modification GTPase